MPDRFVLPIRILHWMIAALVLAMLFIGIAMVSTAGPAYARLLALHRPLGIAILVLALLRLAIRLATRAPQLPADLSPFHRRIAQALHWLLYAAMIGLPLIGWGMLSAGSYPVQLAPGLNLPAILPEKLALFGWLRRAHGAIAFAFFALILAHLTAALVHALIRRDGVFEAMSFGRSNTRRRR